MVVSLASARLSGAEDESMVNIPYEEHKDRKQIQQKRYRLFKLYHAHTCNATDCPNERYCDASKNLFKHIIGCQDGSMCPVPTCKSSKQLWNHYQNCNADNCSVCTVLPQVCVSVKHSDHEQQGNSSTVNSYGKEKLVEQCEKYEVSEGSCERSDAIPDSRPPQTISGLLKKPERGAYEQAVPESSKNTFDLSFILETERGETEVVLRSKEEMDSPVQSLKNSRPKLPNRKPPRFPTVYPSMIF